MLLDKIKSYQVFLVSQSPRRRELLRGMGIDFEVMKADVDEQFNPTLPPAEVVKFLSKLKLSSIQLNQYAKNSIFITCDTIVVIDGQIIGKPKDQDDAIQMVRALSGNTHTVYSGLTVATPEKMLTDYRSTDVTFVKLSDEEIQYYVQQYKPFDKAGAYGVQEWIGYIGIQGIQGSFYNVMGLPTRLLWEMLGNLMQD